MKLRLTVLFALCSIGLFTAVDAADDDTDAPPEGVEVQTRGPVHEAFAEATKIRGEPGAVVNRPPPEPIEEVPPEEKPDGNNVTWIPGYWTYDEEASDFLWVSGFWREEPPGRDWVPGEWHKVDGGYQRVSGFWAPENQEEVEYLPPPPESLDRGPAVPAPDDTSTYIPGCWLFQSTRYVWQPGHWIEQRPGWVWTPRCYKWTPAGYVFVAGYWDRPLAERGMLFAPVRISRAVYSRRNFVYRPAHVIQADFLLGSLFVRANTRKYYFGDYFEATQRARYIPWMDYRVNRVTHDVNYSYYRAAFARSKGAAWEQNLRTLYKARYANEIPRPPRTLVQQTKVVNNITVNKTYNKVVHKNVNITQMQNVTVVQPIRRVKNYQVTGLSSLAGAPAVGVKKDTIHREVKVTRVHKEAHQEQTKQVERYRAIAQERRTREVKMAAKTTVTKMTTAATVKYQLPKTVPARPARVAVKTPPPPVHPKISPKAPLKGPPKKP